MFLHKLNILLLGLIALTWSSFGNGAPSVSKRRSYKDMLCGHYLCNKSVKYGFKSIARTEICDGVNDCPLRDDELDCPCKPLPAPDNGRVSYTGNKRYTLIAHFTCDRRFELAGDSSRMCQPPGIWLGNNPSCTATECPPLPEDTHGRFKIDPPYQNEIGTEARLECDPGYAVYAPVITVCLSNGSWSPVESSCQLRECPPLPEDTHGRFKIDPPYQNEIGAEARLVCDPGYAVYAPVITVCLSNGSWSPVESSCQLRDCGDPDELDPHGDYKIISGNGYDGSIAILTCDSNFKIASGFCTIVACENGTWTTPNESCQAVCPHLPDVVNGTMQYSGLSLPDSLLPGAASASLVCDAGYEPSAAAILNSQCVGTSENAVWTGFPLGPCEVSECPDGWMLYGGSCYLLGDTAMTYFEALVYCACEGAQVVFLETEEENDFVKTKLNDAGVTDHYWLGIDDIIEPGVWKSSTSGQTVPFFDWASTPSDEPNNGATGSERCVIFWKGSTPVNYLWGDAPCSFGNTRPVCERKL